METKHYKKGEVIFREMTIGRAMYEIKSGKVGIFALYEKPEEQKLTELGEGRIFGEMAVVEVFPRSATAVALEDTEAVEIPAEDMQDYFNNHPEKLIEIMRAMSRRIRELTGDYDAACDALEEWKKAAGEGSKKRSGLMALLEKFAEAYSMSLRYSGNNLPGMMDFYY